MDTQLSKSTSGYLVGDRCTIADLACWGWVASSSRSFPSPSSRLGCGLADRFAFHSCEDWAGVSLDEFPHLNAWVDRILARPACEKGRHVPKRHTALDNRHKTEEEMDKAAAEARAWVQKGMAEDAKK